MFFFNSSNKYFSSTLCAPPTPIKTILLVFKIFLIKVVFKVSPHHTSQECADCGHIQPENRKTQDSFVCCNCGHSDNADINATKVIKKRAITFIKHSGTELSKTGVLTNKDIGHGDKHKTLEGKPTLAIIKKPSNRKKVSKKKEPPLCA